MIGKKIEIGDLKQFAELLRAKEISNKPPILICSNIQIEIMISQGENFDFEKMLINQRFPFVVRDNYNFSDIA
jgi:hypothetical protein